MSRSARPKAPPAEPAEPSLLTLLERSDGLGASDHAIVPDSEDVDRELYELMDRLLGE